MWRTFLLGIIYFLSGFPVVHGDTESVVRQMETNADQALDFLNQEHDSRYDQIINYNRALRYLALALDVFDRQDCENNNCDPEIINIALSIYEQAAQVHLDLVEHFYQERLDKQGVSLNYAKHFSERALKIIEAYYVGEKAESHFAEILKRHRKLEQKHQKEELDRQEARREEEF